MGHTTYLCTSCLLHDCFKQSTMHDREASVLFWRNPEQPVAKVERAHSLPPEVGGELVQARRREGRRGEERDDRDREKTKRRHRERGTLLDDDSILVALRCRSRQPSGGLSEPKSPGAIEGRVRSGYRRGKFAASHPSYKFGDSRGFKIFGILCFNCFASAWPLELRQFGSFKCHVGAGLPSGCLAVDRAVDRAIATKIRISLHSRSRLSPTGDQMLPGRPSVSENSLAGSWT